ncbi:MAG: hypothetical protein K8L91_03225 [Anaerolineae bacterium]|nr:hypothetical protein [Anaerolineae bacterium]
MRRIIFVTFAAVLILLPPVIHVPHLAAHAQNDDEWFAYVVHVYGDVLQQELIRVDEDGNTQTYALPVQVARSGPSGFSPDGQLITYCEADDEATQLVMWDIAAERPVWTRNFGPTSACRVSGWGFDPTNKLVAIGIGSDNDHAGDGPHWRIVVLDVSNGDLVYELNDQMESVIAFGLDVFGDVALLPFVKHFADGEIIFVLDPSLGTEYNQLQAYRWTIESGTIELVDYWGSQVADFLPETGEMLMVESDGTTTLSDNLPRGNSLKLVDADGVRTLYQQPDITVMSAMFVNDGQAIFVNGFDAAAFANHFVVITREGEVQDLEIDALSVFPLPARGGFILDKTFYDIDAPIKFQLALHRGGEVDILWQLENDPKTEVDFAVLVFSLPTPAAPDLAPFPEMTLP